MFWTLEIPFKTGFTVYYCLMSNSASAMMMECYLISCNKRIVFIIVAIFIIWGVNIAAVYK
jgi:hypothetical protein